MTSKIANAVTVGKYTGIIGERYRSADFLAQLVNIKDLLDSPAAGVITGGRNRNVRITLPCGGRFMDVAIKDFSRQSVFKDVIDRTRRGSKARRTWEAASFLAERDIGTPCPIGFMEYRQNHRLIESYFIAEYEDEISSFKDELVNLFHKEPECEKFMNLLQCVADAVRKMHDTGFLHNDLGNQNILLRRKGSSAWGGVKFVDLNRSRLRQVLTPAERARDVSRIYLPSDLLRVFKEMCFAPDVPPAGFQLWEKYFRCLYAVHSGTRWLRHPFRTLRNRHIERRKLSYPREKDMWIWDERSGQPIVVMRPKDRSKHYGVHRHFDVVKSTLVGILPVWMEYRKLIGLCYQRPVRMERRVGMAISPKPETADRVMSLFEDLGDIPVFLRFYCHEGEKEWGFLAHIAKTLHGKGHKVSVALVQDRNAVVNPGAWALFIAHVLERIGGFVDYVEVGHAINRVKWGVWNFDEQRRLLEAVAAIAGQYPDIRFMGPAVIDFEYPFLMAALRNVPENLHFASLSHHLYVDRRGAPEKRQGIFSALEKFALAKAIAHRSMRCDDSLIVSEVNWPLKGTGVYSPVGAPYVSPGPRFNDPSVSEDEYADYMLRYLLIALCSGMVDRVYWWRLVARGYGLVDDSDPRSWRKRPAYFALKYFLAVLGSAEFSGMIAAEQSGVQVFSFSSADGTKVCVAYSTGGDMAFSPPFAVSSITNALGDEMAMGEGGVILSGRPIYMFRKQDV